jgi:endonuclease-3 related protein
MDMEAAYAALIDCLGAPERPAHGSAFEAAIRELLSPRRNPRNADRVIDRLRERELLDARRLAERPLDELEALLCGLPQPRAHAARLRNFARYLVARYDGSPDAMMAGRAERLREELTAIPGIGAATADAILMRAAGKPSFAVSAASRRVAVRHGWVAADASYDELREYFQDGLDGDAARLGDLDALLSELGKRYCRAREARCTECPLRPFLPESGPIEPEW